MNTRERDGGGQFGVGKKIRKGGGGSILLKYTSLIIEKRNKQILCIFQSLPIRRFRFIFELGIGRFKL